MITFTKVISRVRILVLEYFEYIKYVDDCEWKCISLFA